jgi:uncharacterized protein (DUF488 family)
VTLWYLSLVSSKSTTCTFGKLLTSEFPALSAHVLVEAERNCHKERFDIHHTTLQVDHATSEVLELSRKEESEEGLKRTSSKS